MPLDDHALSFKNLSQIGREGTRYIASGDYTAFIGESPKFVIIQCTNKSKFAALDKSHEEDKAKDAKMGITDREGSIGWKIHISVAREDAEKAWPIIRAIIMEHQISTLKITLPKTYEEAIANPLDEKLQSVTQAKQFTIYADSDNYTPEKWQAIMQQVELALRKNNIKPADNLPVANRQVEGSAYLTYRNDAALFQNDDGNDDKPTYKARYYADDKAKFVATRCSSLSKQKSLYNISGFPDPFGEIRLTPNDSTAPSEDQKTIEKPTHSPFFAAKAAAATPAKESSTTHRLPAQHAAKPK